MAPETSNDWKKTAARAAILITALAAVAAALLLFYSSWCAMTNLKYADSADYTRYENMMWNTAHGRPFECNGGGDSYLRYHLSFTLGLLSFLFRVWDHPLLLAVVDWLLMVAGGIVLAAAARRVRVPGLLIASLLLYWAGSGFMQRNQLSGFHGVSLYLLLYPLLYLALLNRKYVLCVLLLILGVREDAGLMIAPLLIYFGVRHRYRMAYVFAGVALAYTLFAMFAAYPLINGVTLLQNRANEMSVVMASRKFEWQPRLSAMLWFVLPILPLLLRGWKPILALPSIAAFTNLLSANPGQFAFDTHYAATPFVLLCIALCEAARESSEGNEAKGRTVSRIAPAWLILVTLVSYYQAQLLPGSGQQPKRRDLIYKIPGTQGQNVLRIVRHHLPREGVLLTEPALGKFVANRVNLNISNIGNTPELWENLIFCRKKLLPLPLLNRIASGAWGVLYLDSDYIILRRGANTAKNADFLRTLRPPKNDARAKVPIIGN